MEEQPHQSETQQESADQRQKRYELLYAYARMSYDEEKRRLDEAEAKAARLFPLIVLLLGVVAREHQLPCPITSQFYAHIPDLGQFW